MQKSLFLFLLVTTIHSATPAETNKTYTTTPSIQWYACSNAGCITQTFAVPSGEVLTKVEFYVDDSGVDNTSNLATLALYSGYYAEPQKLVQAVSVPANAINSGDWLALNLDTPQPPGVYYLQVWSSDATYNSSLKGLLYSDSHYYGGCAAQGAAGTTLLDENQDFRGRFTTEAIPPVDPPYPLRNGDFRLYDYSGTALDWQTVVEAGEYTFALEPARSYLYNTTESAVTITAVTPGVAYWSQSLDIPPGDYTLTVDVQAPGSAVARLAAGNAYLDVSGIAAWQTTTVDFSAINSTDVFLYSLGSGAVKFRRASVSIRTLDTYPVPCADGSALGGIALAAEADAAESYAAYELQRCIHEMTGLTPGLEGRDTTHPGRRIIIGSANDSAVLSEIDTLKNDSYLIRLDPSGDIILAGNTPRGTLYATYDFLKLQGCAWHMPGPIGSVIPERTDLILPDPNRLEIPDWEIRGFRQHAYQYTADCEVGNLNPEDYFDWCVRNRLNAFCNGEYQFSHNFGNHRGGSHQQKTDHSWRLFLLNNRPEWWVLVDGVRTKLHTSGRPNQLCVSNAELRDWVVEYILNYFAAYPERTMFSLSPEDEPCYWCECEHCRALDPDGGTGPWTNADNGVPALDMADRSIDFVNDVAARVAAAYPDNLIQMYAYASTRNPPTTKTVHPNVLVKYCWAGAPVDRPILEMSHDKNILTQNQVLGWRTAGAEHLGLYSYGNYFHNDSPNFHYFHENDYQRTFYQDWGFEHFFGESDNHLPQSHMLYNLMALNLWDTDTDYLANIANICQQFYGPAADAMIDYYTFMQAHPLNSDIWQYDDGYIRSLNLADFPVTVLEQGRTYLEQACNDAGADPIILQRLAYARFGHAVMTYEVGTMDDPVTWKNRQTVGQAFTLARELARQYDIRLYARFCDLLERWDYVPTGYAWDRSAEWTDALNPDDDLLGNDAWQYQCVDRGAALGQLAPWYTQTCVDMEWDGTCWKSPAANAARICPETLQCQLSENKNPVMLWSNKTTDIFDARITGDMTIEWSANCDATDIDVVIAYRDVSTDLWTELLGQTVSKPGGKVPYAETTIVPVDVITPESGAHDRILISLRPHAAAGAGTITLTDNVAVTVTSLASQFLTPTYTGGETGRWYSCNSNNCITQSFVVPQDHTLTGVEFYLNDGTHDGKTSVDPAAGYELNLALKAGDYGTGTLVQLITVPQEQTDYVCWIKMPLETPQPSGKYYLQLWSNQSAYNARLHGWLVSESDYVPGRAASGWNGVSLLGADEDFKAGINTRTTCGAEGTSSLLADLTGPDGQPDCYVDQLDLELMTHQWLQCHVAEIPLPLVNGDFEDETTVYPNGAPLGWTVNHHGIGVFPAPAAIWPTPNASANVCIFNKTSTPLNQIIYQYVPHAIQSNHIYTFTADICNGADLGATSLPAWTSISMQLWADPPDGGAKQQLIIETIEPNMFAAPNSWLTVNRQYTADSAYEGWTLFVQFQVLGGIQPFMDDIRISEQPADAGASEGCVEFLQSDIAGPNGVGWNHRDFYVNLLDFTVVASQWLTCTDPANLYNCP